MQAVNCPLVIVCAGAGYGKTSAVQDFIREYSTKTTRTIWLPFTQFDNEGARFWENFLRIMEEINHSLAQAIGKLGFPDTPDKLEQYTACMHKYVEKQRRILVLDDFHIINSPPIIRFFERTINNFPSGTSVFIITRNSPEFNYSSLLSKGRVFNITESDLCFTENELSEYFRLLNILPGPKDLREIMQDTEGWAFAINLVARSFQKAPGYEGYLRKAMKLNIFKLMETEIWDGLTEEMQCFLARLSLIRHLSFDLIVLLAGKNKNLTAELDKLNAYIRRDTFIHAYIIHPLFLEFISARQHLLTDKEKSETYSLAGKWCNKNGFKIDALSYFEKIGDYNSVVSIFSELPMEIPYDIAKYASEIFDRAPAKAFETIEGLVVLHIRSYICRGMMEKSIELIHHYEKIFLKMPKKDAFRNDTLAILYFSLGTIKKLLCVTNNVFDFDACYEKFCAHAAKPGYFDYSPHCPGPWTNACGSSKKGAVKEFIECLGRSLAFIKKKFNGFTTGELELCQGELFFYQGDFNSAQSYLYRALEISEANRQYEVEHRVLVYLRRLGIALGDYPMAEKALKDMKALFDKEQYPNRYINYELDLTWYYCMLGLPEKAPDRIKQKFSHYKFTGFIENYANQMKAWYYYTTRNYPPILSYIHELKSRESFLFSRIEMLAMEACIYNKMKDKKSAFNALREACETAEPNGIIFPFIELGKDMRTLSSSAIKEKAKGIPVKWLETLNRKAASYAKRRLHVISEYRNMNNMVESVILSPREKDVLSDLSHGLSRAEIASSRNLSINTVKMVINRIYTKVGAENLTDLIRIAVERKMI